MRKSWKEFNRIVDKYNENLKNILIPFDEVAQICYENDYLIGATKYIQLHDDIHEKVYFLKGMKEYEIAAKLAFENKN